MSQRILVFENDPAFAEEVKSSFERMGALVQVAADGPSGLELAAGNKPDLILLTIELPGMNGFLVCKKIKKTVELEHVPLVILSSEVDEETFEQHKKLRTRADDYIRKPIAFTDLLERVKPLVPLNGASQALGHAEEADAAVAAGMAEGEPHDEDHADAISVADDEVLVLGDEEDAHSGDTDVSQQRRSTPLAAADAEIQLGAEPSTGKNGSQRAAVSADPFDDVAVNPALVALGGNNAALGYGRAQPVAGGVAEEPAARGHVARSGDSSSTFRVQPSADSTAELERLRRELSAAEEKEQAAEKRAAAAEQRASASDKALDAAKRTGGVSSRELLDMREQLNRKERELLELRGQVTARDKQLIEASEHALVVERDLQDSGDKLLELQRELDKKSELVGALTADKEAGKKRLDDTKARLDRSEAKQKELGLELDEIKARHLGELESLRAQHAQAEQALRTEHTAQQAKLLAEHEAANQRDRQEYTAEIEHTRKEHADELDEQRREHATELERSLLKAQSEHASVLEALRRENAAELEQARKEQAAELERAKHEHDAALARAQTDYTSVLEQTKREHASAVERLQREHAEARTRAEQEHGAALARAQQEHSAALEAQRRAHDEDVAELREEHGVAQKVAADAAEQDKRASLSELTATYEAQIRELQLAQDAERDRMHRKHTAETSELSDKHRQDLARLGRSLSEAEARQALLEEQKEESESARQSTEQSLQAMTNERDQQLARGTDLSAELERLKAKLAHDEETLARVQKAMAIGLGLLEERKSGG